MTDNERHQIVSRIRKAVAAVKESEKIKDSELKYFYILAELRGDLWQLCQDIDHGLFPKEESEVKP